MPAVAMATVRHVSRATISKKSASVLGGTKSPRNRNVGFKLWAEKSVQGLNSASTSMGHRITSAASDQNTRPVQAGSLRGAKPAAMLSGSASPPVPVVRC